MSEPRAVYDLLRHNLGSVLTGQDRAIRLLLSAFAARGHVLIEDLPGTGKTTLAKAFARSLALDFQRVQFTPDLLPADILGVSIFDPREQDFRFHAGPVFTDVLLADEINRASPRVQSALLEAMGERQVSIDGQRHALSPSFVVIATQNPIELAGTYPLPEAQMDRFALRFPLGYIARDEEIEVLSAQTHGHPLDRLEPCVDTSDVAALQAAVEAVPVSPELRGYIVDVVAATRSAEDVAMGASLRASLTLMRCAQALALFDGHACVLPEHVQELAVPVIAHRIKLDSHALHSGTRAEDRLREIVEALPVPQ